MVIDVVQNKVTEINETKGTVAKVQSGTCVITAML